MEAEELNLKLYTILKQSSRDFYSGDRERFLLGQDDALGLYHHYWGILERGEFSRIGNQAREEVLAEIINPETGEYDLKKLNS